MKIINNTLVVVALGVSAMLPMAVLAQVAAAASASAGDLTEAEVRKIDKENKKITLKHGAIKNLDMPPMVMVFGVSDAALLDKVKMGDKVHFKASNDGGKYTVTELQPAK